MQRTREKKTGGVRVRKGREILRGSPAFFGVSGVESQHSTFSLRASSLSCDVHLFLHTCCASFIREKLSTRIAERVELRLTLNTWVTATSRCANVECLDVTPLGFSDGAGAHCAPGPKASGSVLDFPCTHLLVFRE